MLNNFRIGTKLIGGFAIVLVLLIIVWQVGRWAIQQKTDMAAIVAASDDKISAALQVQRDIYSIMSSISMETITRDKRYADEVQDKVKNTLKEHEGDLDMLKIPEDKARYKKVLDGVKRLGEADAASWNIETRRQDIAAKQTEMADKITEELASLSEAITGAAEETAIKQREETSQQELTYFRADQVYREQKTSTIDNRFNRIRRNYFQYEGATTAEDKKNIRNRIKMRADQIHEVIQELDQEITRPEVRAIFSTIVKDIDQWYGYLIENMDLLDQFAITDAESSKLTAELVAGIEPLLKSFEEQGDAAQKEDAAFNVRIQWILTIASLLAILLGGIISFVLTQNIKLGIGRSVSAMKTIADDGNVEIEIAKEDIGRKDEVGDLAGALGNILHQFQNVERLAVALADGDYRVDTKVRGNQDSMNINLNKMLTQVNDTLHEINESVKQVATGSGEVSTAATSLSSGSQEAAASLEEITASMSEISSQTKTNAESAGQARDLAQKASKAAAEGQEAMQEMTASMGKITENSTEIQRVIKVIDDIAFQTNLLALNAAVEAARAGQHGKGFAVVAEEGRNLAARSAKAARETTDLIAKSGHEIEKGGEVANRTAEVLNTIVEQIKQTTDLVAGIAVASNEQAQGVAQVSIGLSQIDSVTQQNTAAAEESASAANEMSSMAENLQKLVAQFKLR